MLPGSAAAQQALSEAMAAAQFGLRSAIQALPGGRILPAVSPSPTTTSGGSGSAQSTESCSCGNGVLYSNDFEGTVGNEWSSTQTDTTPTGNRRFLGQFGNSTASLTLNNLPAHTALTVSLDLFVIRSWDGNGMGDAGPDTWEANVTGIPTPLLRTTFSNIHFPVDLDGDGKVQDYPQELGGLGQNPARTGAEENDTLGYTFNYSTGTRPADSVYHLTLSFPHTTSSVTLNFTGSGLQGLSDESWGLDNVTVTDAQIGTTAANRQPLYGPMGDPQDRGTGVMLHNGTFSYSQTDLAIPGRGLDWSFTRTYRSDVTTRGPLGPNWDFNYNRRLIVLNEDASLANDNLSEARLTFPTAKAGDVIIRDGFLRDDLYVRNTDSSYTSPPGFFTRLVKNANNTFTERDRDGTVISYGVPLARGVAPMTRMADRNGNAMTFMRNAEGRLDQVVDSLGRVITYTYTGCLLTQVTDFAGRSLVFTYSTNCDLETVRSPIVSGTPTGNDFLSGKIERYGYSSGFSDGRFNHNLETITAPNEVASSGPPRVQIFYHYSSFSPNADRVFVQVLGGPNGTEVPAGGTLIYTYLSQPTTRTTVLDANGNSTAYDFNALNNIVLVNESTNRNIRPNEPDYETIYAYNGDYLLTQETLPLSNTIVYGYAVTTDRFQQGNLVSVTQNPDAARGGDQTFLKTTSVYEPIYNQSRTQTDPRGNDPAFVPPFGGAASAGRYTTTTYFDYQEATEKASMAPDTRLDKDGSGGQVNQSPLIGVDANVKTTEVWLVQILGLPENSSGLTDLRGRLSASGVVLGLGDLNGDNDVTPAAAGNVVRIVSPTAHLLPGSNQASLAGQVLLDGKATGGTPIALVDTTRMWITDEWVGRAVEITRGTGAGQVRRIAANGPMELNVTASWSTNPDSTSQYVILPIPTVQTGTSSGGNTPTTLNDTSKNWVGDQWVGLTVEIISGTGTGQVRTIIANTPTQLTVDSSWTTDATSGYAILPTSLSQFIVERFRYNSFGQLTSRVDPEENVDAYLYHPENDPDGNGTLTPAPPDGRVLSTTTGGYLKETTQDTTSAAGRNSGTNPTPVNLRRLYELYDVVGNLLREVDGRGIRTEYSVNQLNQVVQATRAAAVGVFTPDPGEPLALTALQYLERTFYDFNDNVVLRQVEDRGNTSSVDGNLPAGELPPGVPGVANADPTGGTAFADTSYRYDILDHQVEKVQEVTNGGIFESLRTSTRYDANGNPVLTILPEENANSSVYDERDLLFQSTSGADTRPAAGLYKAVGDPTTFNRPGGVGTVPSTFTRNYDGNRNTIETVDAQSHGGTGSTIAGVGDATRTTYDGFDRQKIVTDPLGNTGTSLYDPASNVVRVIQNGDPINDVAGATENKTLAVTEYIHDEMSRMVVTHQVLFQTPDMVLTRTPILTDNGSMDTLAAYLADASGDTAAVPGVLGSITVLGRISNLTEYDRNSRVTFTVQDDLDTYRTLYDGASRTIKTIDSALNNGFSAGAFNPANLSGNTSETAYDDNSNPIESKDTEVTTVAGVAAEVFRTTSFYDSLGRLAISVDNRGHASDYRYDSRDNLVAMADAVGPVGARMLPRRGLGSTANVAVNDFGNVTRNFYDGISRRVESETLLAFSGQGNGTYIGADLNGVKSEPPGGYLDTANAGDGRINTYYAFDSNSQLLALRDDNGNTTAYVYDNQNRTKVERKGLAEVGTTFSIAGGDSGRFNVALRGGMAVVDTEAAGTDIAFTYDQDSNVVTRVDEATNSFASTFDALNRKKTSTITLAAGFIGTTSQTWEFDGLSRQTVSFDNNSSGTTDDLTVNDFYDSLSRQVEETQKIGTLAAQAVSYNFDIAAGGAVAQATSLLFPDSRRLDSTFDGLDRLVSRRDNGMMSAIGTYQYIGPSRVAVLTYQNNTRLTHIGQVMSQNADVGFDNLRRVVNHRWEGFSMGTALGSGTLVVGFGHQQTSGNPAYDRANNKLIEEKLHDTGTTPTLGNSEVYTYQSDYQLRTFNRGTLDPGKTFILTPTTSTGALQSQSFTLDGLGNWSANTHTTVGSSASTENRTSTDFNEIGTVSGTPYGSGATGTHVLDKNGNLLDDGVRTYQYDALNRLRKVSRKGDGLQIAEYSYDAGNRRFRKVVTNGGLDNIPALNGTTDFYYDGWRVIEEHDGTNAITQQYVYGNYLDEVWTLDRRAGGTITIGQLNDGSGSDRYFFHSNTLYSVHGLTNETGALVEAYQYDPYGRQTVIRDGSDMDTVVNFTADDMRTAAGASQIGNPYLYTGQRLDAETKLDYYKNRYYSADLGRFIHRDPDGYAAGDNNLYRYVAGNPVNALDPSGLDTYFLLARKGSLLAFTAGHAALLIGPIHGGHYYFMSFSIGDSPQTTIDNIKEIGYDNLDSFRRDPTMERYGYYMQFATTTSESEQAYNFMHYNGPKLVYRLFKRNCEQVAAQAILAAGVPVVVHLTPQQFYNDKQNQNLADSFGKITTATPLPDPLSAERLPRPPSKK